MNPIELADIILSMIKNVYNSASDTSKDFFKVAILSKIESVFDEV